MDVSLKIDGRTVTAPEEMTVLQAAERVGIFIPRYCYHPGLSIAGSCRICQVEIKGRRDPVISCNERVKEGMEVLTDSPMVRRVRRAVMEFLLLNHPIDCPICDTSGECDLQNYYMTEGRHRSRLSHHKINRKKAARIGGRVVLDQERCILCTRCVRFTAEVTKTHELGLFGRGSTEAIDIVDGKALENPYAGCVVDLCPVGALTDDDFRFKCRVWYLEETKSICAICSTGCNVYVHSNTERCWKAGGARLMRLKPRPNPEVNQYWMCDLGRYGYKYVDGADRLTDPLVREGSTFARVSWEEALTKVAAAVKAFREGRRPGRVGWLPSHWMSNEALFLARGLVGEAIERGHVGVKRLEGPLKGDGFLVREDPGPNRVGLETILGGSGKTATPEAVLEAAARGETGLLVVFAVGSSAKGEDDRMRDALRGAPFSVVLGSNWSSFMEEAEVVLPISTHYEADGTYTNYRGWVQRFWQAFPPRGLAVADWQAVVRLGDAGLGPRQAFQNACQVFDRLATTVAAFRGLSYERLGELGAPLAGVGMEREGRDGH
jgi:NADH-quinone oxidoreductase subunit G